MHNTTNVYTRQLSGSCKQVNRIPIHVYVMNYISKLRKIDQDDPHSQLIQRFKSLRMEGIADLIDKVDLLERVNKSDYETSYAYHYHK